MADSPFRAAVRIVAQSICCEVDGPDQEPCRLCLNGAPRLIDRFLSKLPQGQQFTPAQLAAAVKRSGADA
jgi:hypothetical protein